jgi:hypothetical protein
MNFKKDGDINGTSLQGYVTTEYSELVDCFGEPDFGPDDHSGDKVTCEWVLEFEDGTVATIYEWKHGHTPKNRCQWNIGGKSIKAAALVQDALELHRDKLYKMVKEYQHA